MRPLNLFFTLLFLCFSWFSTQSQTINWDYAKAIENSISEPTFLDKEYSILSFGAKRNSSKPITKAIQKAINKCSANGGGRVVVPLGEYITGPITLKSNVNLHLEDGAVLKFSNNPADYYPFVYTRWEGMDCINYRPLIYAKDQENIAITGKGVLDGQATDQTWWYMKGRRSYGWKEGLNSQEHGGGRSRLMKMVLADVPVAERIMTEADCLRPQFINPTNCKTVLIEGVTILRAPFWVIHPLFCENLIVRDVTVRSHGPNNDGCDPESCKNVLIEGCTFDTGDDCIAIKSGRNNDGRRSGVASENFIIRNCTMKEGHGGVVMGSEISAGCRNIFVEDCKMDSPNLDRVIRIKSNTVRGGVIENIFVRNIEVGECREAIFRVELNYEISEGVGTFLPVVRHIELRNVVSRKSRYGVYIEGLKESVQVSDISFVNCSFGSVKEVSQVSGAKDIRFKNVDATIDDMK